MNRRGPDGAPHGSAAVPAYPHASTLREPQRHLVRRNRHHDDHRSHCEVGKKEQADGTPRPTDLGHHTVVRLGLLNVEARGFCSRRNRVG